MSIIGIDLGTTNSLVSVWKDDKIQLIPNCFGEQLTPSIVSFDQDETIYTGQIAKERLLTDSKHTFSEFKRAMGTDRLYFSYHKEYLAEELSSFLLRQLKSDAENYLHEEIKDAIISVPAYFNDKQRAATRYAGQLAGLNVIRLINEPSAASITYHLNNPDKHKLFLVIDFGGGTLDISLVDAFDNIIEIQAVSGDNHLGGKEFNQIIADDICQQFHMKDLSLDQKKVILDYSESIKMGLSSQDEITQLINLDDTSYSYTISNKRLRILSEAIFKRMTLPIQKVINDAEIEITDIDDVVMVGGTTKMPVVREFLEYLFERKIPDPYCPDTVVCIGSGLVASIKERCTVIKDYILSDICPFSLGVDIVDDVYSPIIHKNQILPCSTEKIYTTVKDNQQTVLFSVYQGENLKASDNLLISEIKIKIPPAPAGHIPIYVRFSYDINGIFDVDIRCPNQNITYHKTISDHTNGLSLDEIEQRRETLNKLKMHPRDKEENKYLLELAKRLSIQCNMQQREQIRQAYDIFQTALETQDIIKVRKAYAEFALKLNMIEHTLFHFKNVPVSYWYQDGKNNNENDENDDIEIKDENDKEMKTNQKHHSDKEDL